MSRWWFFALNWLPFTIAGLMLAVAGLWPVSLAALACSWLVWRTLARRVEFDSRDWTYVGAFHTFTLPTSTVDATDLDGRNIRIRTRSGGFVGWGYLWSFGPGWPDGFGNDYPVGERERRPLADNDLGEPVVRWRRPAVGELMGYGMWIALIVLGVVLRSATA